MHTLESNTEPQLTRRELLLSAGLVITAGLAIWKNLSSNSDAGFDGAKNITHSEGKLTQLKPQ